MRHGSLIPQMQKRGRGQRGPDRRTTIREALTELFPGEGERALWKAIITQAMQGDSGSASIIANRLIAPLQADCEPVALPAPLTGSPAEQALQVVDYVARGVISSVHGKSLMALLADSVKISSGSELLKRLDAIENLLRIGAPND